MISRQSARALSDVMENSFYSYHSGGRSPSYRSPDTTRLYDFLYDSGYEAWFANLARNIRSARDTRGLKDFFLKLHTGETLQSATSTWTWDQRAALGQRMLTDLARDLLARWAMYPEQYGVGNLGELTRTLKGALELDGYVWDGSRLIQTEADALDVSEESGVVQTLYNDIGLDDEELTFHHLRLAEEHYIAEKWDDSIGNSRKFLESVLRQIAAKYARSKGTTLDATMLTKPVRVRDYLQAEGLLEEKEKLAVTAVYGLLSETGGHPYVAQQDQARLMRHLAVTFSQFGLLRLRGALAACA